MLCEFWFYFLLKIICKTILQKSLRIIALIYQSWLQTSPITDLVASGVFIPTNKQQVPSTKVSRQIIQLINMIWF